MTMINALALGGTGVMATDDAFYDATGVIHFFDRKSVILSAQHTVLAVRGRADVLGVLAEQLEAFRSFDAIVADAGALIRDRHEAGAFQWSDDPENSHFDLVVLGWSATGRMCRCFALSTLAHPGLEPFRFHRRDVFMAPAPLPADMEKAGLMRGGYFVRPRSGNLKATLINLAKLQRSQRYEVFPGSAAKAHIVGGEVRMTTVTRDGITEEVIHRWPDDVAGEFIEPAIAANVVSMDQWRRGAVRTAAGRGQ